jgi:hypothetical protein
MSNIGNTHLVQKLEKQSTALSGQRMARVIAKKNKDGSYESANLSESKFVSVPLITELAPNQISVLMPHVLKMIWDVQDSIIRELIVNDGITSVHDDQISVDAVSVFLDESAKGSRITTEYLAKWFTESYLEAAMQFVCVMSKFDPDTLTPEQEQVIEKKCAVLRDMFTGWASPRYSPDIPKCKGMIKFGEFLGEVVNDDARMSAYLKKAQEVKEVKEKELSCDALGF